MNNTNNNNNSNNKNNNNNTYLLKQGWVYGQLYSWRGPAAPRVLVYRKDWKLCWLLACVIHGSHDVTDVTGFEPMRVKARKIKNTAPQPHSATALILLTSWKVLIVGKQTSCLGWSVNWDGVACKHCLGKEDEIHRNTDLCVNKRKGWLVNNGSSSIIYGTCVNSLFLYFSIGSKSIEMVFVKCHVLILWTE